MNVMMMMKGSCFMNNKNVIIVMVMLIIRGGHGDGDALRHGFYRNSCPHAESIVQNSIWKSVSNNPHLSAKFLRMHFHDCFVRGCDASILLDSTPNSKAEKRASPNQSLTGYKVIEDIKTQLEQTCPGVVSCADIVALAARDAVSFQFGKHLWAVQTGRRDGHISRASEAETNIIPPTSNFSTALQGFTSKGLALRDLVVLTGAHTLGFGHCKFFNHRLYNFTGKGDADPSLNPTYAAFLKRRCPRRSANTTAVSMDESPHFFDAGYFVNLVKNRGLFQTDAALMTDNQAAAVVNDMLVPGSFYRQFAGSIIKMGRIQVLTGTEGEIRKKCNVVN
ncbi:peroxidase 3-like [Malania oleifera]|uniref:peroxidase 3-like n=1 Tax=Malania oleifera TaxID=397392 RepID=UPI0025AE531C|nr:peroxidase 3-like [Malania oleifera]